jgi:vancomycin resistance protein YoaR
MRRRIVLWVAPLVMAVAAGTGMLVLAPDRLFAGRVLPGVTLEGRPIGGLGPEGVAARVHGLAAPVINRRLAVTAAATTAVSTPARLGMRPDVDRVIAAALGVGRTGRLPRRLEERLILLRRPIDLRIVYAYDPDITRAEIARLVAAVVSESLDAVVTVRDGRLVLVSPSEDGVVVDERASLVRAIAALQRGDPGVELVVTLRRPAFTTHDADRLTGPVAEFTTRFPYNPDRVHNIRLAAWALRGVLVAPDAVLSYNRVVGPRDPARGYLKAPVLYNNILIPGDGGGVCQVSSTLFNAALLAEMTVEARSNHSQPVPYLAAGLDATVDYGVLDLRLRNTSGHFLYLWTDVRPRSLTVAIFGARPQRREIAVTVADRVVLPAPSHTVTVKDPYLAAGQTRIDDPKPGLRVRTYRTIRQDGEVVREELVATSYYRPVPRTIRIGTKGARTSEVLRRAPAP